MSLLIFTYWIFNRIFSFGRRYGTHCFLSISKR